MIYPRYFIAIIVMIHHRNVLFEPSHCFTSIIAIFSNLYDKSKTEGQAKTLTGANSEAPWRIMERPRRRGVSGGMAGRC